MTETVQTNSISDWISGASTGTTNAVTGSAGAVAGAVEAPVNAVTGAVGDAVSAVAKPALYFANAYLTLMLAGTLFLIGILLIFPQIPRGIVGAVGVATPAGKVGTVAKIAEGIGK